MRLCINASMHLCIYASMHLWIYGSMDLWIYASMHLCVYAMLIFNYFVKASMCTLFNNSFRCFSIVAHVERTAMPIHPMSTAHHFVKFSTCTLLYMYLFATFTFDLYISMYIRNSYIFIHIGCYTDILYSSYSVLCHVERQ